MNLAPEWITAALELAGIAGALITAGFSIAWWWAEHTRVSRREFAQHLSVTHAEIDRRFAEGENRFGRIDGDIQHRPNQSAIDQLRGVVAELAASVRELHARREAIDQRLERIEAQLARIVDFELRGRP